jgi:hypothetical protein
MIAGVRLDYDPVHDQYQAAIGDPGTVDVTITADGFTLSGSLSRQAPDAGCAITEPDVVHWGFESRAEWSWDGDSQQYGNTGIGLADPSDIDGPLFWPVWPPGSLIEDWSFKKPEPPFPPDGGYGVSIPPLQPPQHPVDQLWVVAERIDNVGMLSGGTSPLWGIANLCGRSVPVNSASLVSIAIDGQLDYPFNTGWIGSLHAVGRFSDGTSADLTGTATWTSSDESIVVIAGGSVIVRGVGTVQVTAAMGDVSATVPVVVESVTLLKIDVTPTWNSQTDSVSVRSGFRGKLRAEAFFSGGWEQDVSAQASWRSEGPSVVSVDGTGQITAGSVGSVRVTATLDGVLGAILVEVTD